jgi:hypothetical protein
VTFDGSHTLLMANVDQHDVGPNAWMACDEPERPFDYECLFDWSCDACTMALIAATVAADTEVGTMYVDGVRQTHIRIGDMLTPALEWRGSVGLATFGKIT